ncbi:MAG TPA: putative lipid II flippase FtsW, partial [Propionibacteriaceae bacterium]|nr:putative lipid II flippase FtsW [Propionibacteriaceae bacterium]
MATITTTTLRRSRFGTLSEAMGRPLFDYYLVLVSAALLAALGALMVLSSSSVEAQAVVDDPYYYARRQAIFLVLSLPLAWLASRLNEPTLKVLGWVGMIGSVALLIAVFTPLGTDQGKGNRAWLDLGVMSVQPSEFAKLGLVVWSAAVLSTKKKLLDQPRHLLWPLLGGFGLVAALVLAGHDLGTTMVIVAIMFGVLWVVGAPLRYIGALILTAVLGVAVMVAMSPNRMTRIFAFLRPSTDDPNASQQPLSAVYALATGGWWGVGLGGSRQKWGGLYDGAKNDFVFAVLGEELGLVGAVSVLLLFAALGWGGMNIAMKADSLFIRITAAGITTWLMFQTLCNIGVAMKMLPVVGVPLPFISAGGTALLSNLVAVGILLACARLE